MVFIDAHTHILESGKGPLGRPAAAEDLLREMDAHGVATAVVIPLPGAASNAFVHEACARHAGRLAGLYTPEFDAPGSALARLEAFFQGRRPAGVKIHPRVQSVSPRDPRVKEIVGWAQRGGVPVVFDAFPYGPTLDDPDLLPLAFHGLAREFPRATIVLAHAGGYKAMEAFLVAKANPNVVLDLSFSLAWFEGSSVERDLLFAVRRLPAGKAMYGSDFPEVDFGGYLARAREALADLPQDRREALFGGTAARVFRL